MKVDEVKGGLKERRSTSNRILDLGQGISTEGCQLSFNLEGLPRQLDPGASVQTQPKRQSVKEEPENSLPASRFWTAMRYQARQHIRLSAEQTHCSRVRTQKHALDRNCRRSRDSFQALRNIRGDVDVDDTETWRARILVRGRRAREFGESDVA